MQQVKYLRKHPDAVKHLQGRRREADVDMDAQSLVLPPPLPPFPRYGGGERILLAISWKPADDVGRKVKRKTKSKIKRKLAGKAVGAMAIMASRRGRQLADNLFARKIRENLSRANAATTTTTTTPNSSNI